MPYIFDNEPKPEKETITPQWSRAKFVALAIAAIAGYIGRWLMGELLKDRYAP